jgi:hypothetical protein
MKTLAIAVGLAMLVPSLAWAHGGGLDQYGCHNDTKKGEYHCHQGKLKGRTFKSQDTMLAAHPELKGGESKGEQAKKEKAEDKLKDGDKTTTDQYAKEAKDAKKKTSSSKR